MLVVQVRAVADIQSGGATYPSLEASCVVTKNCYDSKQTALDAVLVDYPVGRSYFCSGRTQYGLYLETRPGWPSGYVNQVGLLSCLVMFILMIGVLIGSVVSCLRNANRKESAAPVEMVG